MLALKLSLSRGAFIPGMDGGRESEVFTIATVRGVGEYTAIDRFGKQFYLRTSHVFAMKLHRHCVMHKLETPISIKIHARPMRAGTGHIIYTWEVYDDAWLTGKTPS